MDLKSEIKGGRKGGRAEATVREIQITKVRGIQLSAKKEEEETTKEKAEKRGRRWWRAAGGCRMDARAGGKEQVDAPHALQEMNFATCGHHCSLL